MRSYALFGLSAAARAAGVSEDTMKKYADVGVVTPARDSAGKRLFTEADIERAREYRNRSRTSDAGE